jgi:AraC family transcriptional regulator, regulatory protein of adaptative response / methylated-DNA-[protein]-cysteine methyltransferase
MDAVISKTLRAAAPADQDAQWRAVVARDASANGTFVYSVRSTGVYCRPSCPSRLAKRTNVQFHASPKDAERAGFRPCRRCKPDQPGLAEQQAAKVAEACRFIEAADRAPSLDELAKRARMSAFHFHRVFKGATGVTPAAYARGERAKRMREGLSSRHQSVTQSIYEAGFNSNSRFYEKADELLGMKPSEYRAGGANNAIHFSVGECFLGSILVARSERGVCAIFLGDDPETLVHELEDRFPNAELIGGDKDFEKLVAKVVAFVEAPRLSLDLPLDVRGTAFQQRVWRALQKIPAGKTVSYADVAKRIGFPKAVRAVASACAANAIAVAIPCHRVVRKGGGLSGYRWGVERKRALLKREESV